MKFLVTGANGFVGNALVMALQHNGYFVRRALRNRREAESDAVAVGNINGLTCHIPDDHKYSDETIRGWI